MTELRTVYAQKAISQIPRLLSFQDRNPLSPTYGCFDRVYWLDKAIDFPSAVYQFAVHTLALSTSIRSRTIPTFDKPTCEIGA